MASPFAAHIGRCFTHRFVAAPDPFPGPGTVILFLDTRGCGQRDRHAVRDNLDEAAACGRAELALRSSSSARACPEIRVQLSVGAQMLIWFTASR
jgi:hypothetical protein